MTTKTRTQNALYNSASSLVLFPLKLLVQFVNRSLFIKLLGIYYLGLNGIFSNILGMLSVAELGLGASIVFALYKPIAENNNGKIIAYMNLYSKAYRFIALIIFGLGLIVSHFLPVILQVSQLSFEETVIYILFLINSVIGYLLFSYKRSLLNAHQENYIVLWLDFGLYVVTTICQWVIMWWTHQYILVLILTICSTILSNLLVAFVTNKRHPLKDIVPELITQEEKALLKKNVLGNIIGNIATVIVFSTDNILISSFISVTTVGIYSNYTLITNAFNLLLSQIMVSQSASVGNLVHTTNSAKVYEVYKRYQFVNFISSYLVSLLIFILINPFIVLWIGQDYLLSTQIVLLLSIYIFLQTYRYSGFILYNAYGLYWESRHKPIVEAVLNLVISLLFLVVFKWGISGILLGTICSNVLTNSWFEPYIIFKYGLKRSMKEYIWINILQWIVYFVTLFGLYFLAPQKWFASNLMGWIQMAIVIGSSLVLLLLIVFRKDVALKWWIDFVRKRFEKIFRKILKMFIFLNIS
ncbi:MULTISPECIES: transporter [unclassified Facklamia]|uniref:lipopolysaccharide biosynthesis protein n=1 Tax=Aerococcaceae TaxID=186827 RepID=UPI0013BADF37|nr:MULTISPECIES: transporter [unclassified Facklamia]MBS4462459.1 transporter [Aerococcaceae bacterium zg-B36]NEW65046.1 transporter [Facklamia sp. 252]NEW68627.1 transporter [Facklamia sp. 253]QQD65111.1 transporter [Aerococcaceae bacterium zg-252]